MQGFDVLTQDIALNRNIFIEASAGTGKTFTLEHLVVRRLLEPLTLDRPVTLSQMAIVTFTKAAANDLRRRIAHTISHSHALLENDDAAPHYLEVIRKSPVAAIVAKEKLRNALPVLDTALICTIHRFAASLLSEYFYAENGFSEESWISEEELASLITDYFQFSLHQELISPQELHILLQESGLNEKQFISTLQGRVWQPRKEGAARAELVEKLQKVIKEARYSQEEVIRILTTLAGQFCNCMDKNGIIKIDVEAEITNFAALFAGDYHSFYRAPLLATELFSKPKSKSKQTHAAFVEWLVREVDPIIRELVEPSAILHRILTHLEQFLEAHLRKIGRFAMQEVLHQFSTMLENPSFLAFVQSRIAVLFVDEFQDTDPLQWKIFEKIFLGPASRGHMYVVGDPKQSIYAFRNADVYSYMEAKKRFANEGQLRLNTNFRSTSSLTSALNHLFVGPHSTSLFSLPKTQDALEMYPLLARNNDKEGLPSDAKGSIHCVVFRGKLGRKRVWPDVVTEEKIISFIVNEIIRLQLPLRSFAILVKDRFQAARVEKIVEKANIKVHNLRRESVVATEAFTFVIRLFRTLAAPKNRIKLLELLSLPPFSFAVSELAEIKENVERFAEFVKLFINVRKSYQEYGIGRLIDELFSATFVCHGTPMTLKELLAQYDKTAAFYRDVEHVFDLIIDFEKQGAVTLEKVVSYLEELQNNREELHDGREFTRRSDAIENKVTILTMHKSKGLEFDVVFTLGVSTRTQESAKDGEAEKLRQLYVAATRAKKRLYIPILIEEDNKEISPGSASPIELYMQAIQHSLEYLTSHPHITVEQYEEKGLLSFESTVEKPPQYISKADPDISIKPLAITSFSSLQSLTKQHSLSIGDKTSRERGVLLHTLLATLAFDLPIAPQVETILKGHMLQGEQEAICTMITALLEKSLEIEEGTCRLCDVKSLFREREFVYFKNPNQAVRGVMDFAFEYRGFYYLVDWKSHQLTHYDTKTLQEVVTSSGYMAQAEIYTEAFCRYLQSHNIPSERFKGFFFIFLNGLMMPEQGVLYCPRQKSVYG